MRWLRLVLILVAFAAITWIAAKTVDLHVAQWVHETKPLNRGGLIAKAMRWPGWFPFTVGIAIFVGLIHRRHWWAAAPLILSGLLAGVNWLIKWCVGRTRPVIIITPFQFHPFGGGVYHLFHNAGLSFPSGDATMAFAAATCLAILMPRWAVLFFLIAAGTAAERVLENAHYVTDVIAGAGLGILCGMIASEIVERIRAKSSPPDHM